MQRRGETELDVVAQTERRPHERWISEYDYPRRLVTLTLVEPWPHHWSFLELDDELSDPAGNFQVYVQTRRERRGGLAKIVLRLHDSGRVLAAHPDFDVYAIGSLTLWPHAYAGRPEASHWIWDVQQPLFTRSPRSWAEAVSAGDHDDVGRGDVVFQPSRRGGLT